MTTIQSIQSNIHYYKTLLIKIRNVSPNDILEEINKEAGIEFYIGQLDDLRISLKNAVYQASK